MMDDVVYPYSVNKWIPQAIDSAMRFREAHRLPNDVTITLEIPAWVMASVTEGDIDVFRSYGIAVKIRDDESV